MSKDISDILSTHGREAAALRIRNSITRLEPSRNSSRTAPPTGLPQISNALDLTREHISLPPVLIEGMLHRGETMVFGGGAKTNKTHSLMDLAVSVASGTPWWNLKTQKGKVLYMDFELQKGFFIERLKTIVAEKNIPEAELANIDVWNLRGHAEDISDLIDGILAAIKDRNYSLIIIDPIYKALGGRDENAAGDINSLMNELDKMAVQARASIIVGHHFSKGNQAGKESIDRVSGSGVFSRSPDSVVTITKHEEKNVFAVETTLRNFKPLEPFCVKFVYPLMVPDETYNPKKLKKAGAAVAKYSLEHLMECLGSDHLTTGEWCERSKAKHGMSKRTFDDKKSMLVANNSVVQNDDGKWYAPHLHEDKPTNKTLSKAKTKPKVVQSANDAIAPSAQSNQCNAGCAVAAVLTAAALTAPM